MVRSGRSRVFSVVVALSLLAVAAGSAQAARPGKSFEATFCYDANFDGIGAAIVATVTWSGQTVSAVGIGTGDGTGAGFGAIQPLDHPLRSGSVFLGIGADDENVVAGADIRLRDKVLDSAEINRPGSSWSGLPGC